MSKNTLKQLLSRKLFIAAAIMSVVVVGGIAGVTLLLASNQLPVVQPENRQPNNNLPAEPVLIPEEPITPELVTYLSSMYNFTITYHQNYTSRLCVPNNCTQPSPKDASNPQIVRVSQSEDANYYGFIGFEPVSISDTNIQEWAKSDAINAGQTYIRGQQYAVTNLGGLEAIKVNEEKLTTKDGNNNVVATQLITRYYVRVTNGLAQQGTVLQISIVDNVQHTFKAQLNEILSSISFLCPGQNIYQNIDYGFYFCYGNNVTATPTQDSLMVSASFPGDTATLILLVLRDGVGNPYFPTGLPAGREEPLSGSVSILGQEVAKSGLVWESKTKMLFYKSMFGVIRLSDSNVKLVVFINDGTTDGKAWDNYDMPIGTINIADQIVESLGLL